MNYINLSNLELLNHLLKEAEHDLDCAKKLMQSKRTKVDCLRQLLGNQTTELPTPIETSKLPQPIPRIVAIKNGKRVPDFNAQNIKEDEYDLILDMTTATLKYRKDPVNKSELKLSKREGIGSERIQPLARLLEHPSVNISPENSGLTPDTLAQTICVLRKALEQKGPEGPYIETVGRWNGLSCTAYRLICTGRRYLLIKEEIIENH